MSTSLIALPNNVDVANTIVQFHKLGHWMYFATNTAYLSYFAAHAAQVKLAVCTLVYHRVWS